MAWHSFFSRHFAKKAFTSTRQALLFALRGPSWSSYVNYDSLIKDGFLNAVAFACIMESAGASAGVPWTLSQVARNGTLTPVPDTHEAWKIIRRPNLNETASDFKKAMVAYYYLAGNIFLTRVSVPRRGREVPQELHLLFPDRAAYAPIYDTQGQMIGVIYTETLPNGRTQRRAYALPLLPNDVALPSQDNTTGDVGRLLHIKHFSPDKTWFGQSPLLAAAHAIDSLNAGLAWNTALLQQYGRPSMVFKTERQLQLNDPEYEILKEGLKGQVGGPEKAGDNLILTGGLSIDKMGFNATEMDWLKGMDAAGLHVCRVLNVAPELVGFPGSKTHDNYKTARESLYTENVFPTMMMIAEHLTNWLLPLYGDNLVLGINENAVNAIWEARMGRLRALEKAWWLTLNQRLEMSGLPTIGPAGAVRYIPSNLTPTVFEEAKQLADAHVPGVTITQNGTVHIAA